MNYNKHITNLHRIIERSLFFIDGKLDYDRVTDAIILLSDTISGAPEDEHLWSIGECSSCCIDDMIIGAYWHYTDYHQGQWSKGYLALSRLGEVFSPNISTLSTYGVERDVYNALASLSSN